MNPEVELFFGKVKKWREEMEKLRMIALDCGLTEEFKWRHPCYAYKGSNIVLIHGFKEYCALLFFKGSLLKDTNGILTQQTENVQAGRQARFTDVKDIIKIESILKAYIFEAIEAERAGLKVDFKKSIDYNTPEELQNRFKEIPELKSAFKALTPGRQRAYIIHFSQPKQSKTRVSRIEKYIPQILDGKGLND